MKGSEVKIVSGPENIKLADLHHRYIPKVTPLNLYPNKDPMLFTESHHVSLLRLILEKGLDWALIATHPYFLERQHRFNIGMSKWNNKKIMKHIKHRWDTYKSLKKHGYNKKLGDERPIAILRKPLFETRFAWESGFLHGPEIYNGAGRCAAAIVLGWEVIRGYWVEDVRPGTCDGGNYVGKATPFDVKAIMEIDRQNRTGANNG